MKPKILTHLRNFYKCTPKEIENLHNERDNALEKIKKLEKKHLSYKNLKEKHTKFKYYTGINVEVFDCLFDYLQVSRERH